MRQSKKLQEWAYVTHFALALHENKDYVNVNLLVTKNAATSKKIALGWYPFKRILKLKKSLSRTVEVRANTGRRMHIFLEWFFAKYGLFFNANIVLVHPAPI